MSRMELAAKAGATFGGNRKLDEALGRIEPNKILIEYYEHRYARGGIAGAVVDKLVTTALRSGADIIENDGVEDRDIKSPWEIAVIRLFERLRVWDVLREAFIECRKGHYSIIVIGAVDGVGNNGSNNPWEQPLVKVPLDTGVQRLWPYGESSIQTFNKRDLIQDESNPLFGYPEFYKVTIGKQLVKKIHYSRVVHIANSLTPWGKPVLERVWDLFDDLEKTTGGGSEGFFQNVGAKDVWNIDPEVEFESTEQGDSVTGDGDIDYDAQATTYEEAIAAHRHSAIDDLILQGVERLPRDIETPDIANNTASIERHIAASSGYPHAVLLGNKEGRLAGEQDDASYRDDVIGYREGFCDRHLRMLIDTFIRIGVIETVEYITSWRRSEKLSPTERSTVINNYAQANLRQSKVDGRLFVEPDEARQDVLGYEPLEQEANNVNGNNGNDVTASLRFNALDDDAPEQVVRLDNTINEFESKLIRRLNKAFKSARSEISNAPNSSDVDNAVDALGDGLDDDGGLGEFFLGVLTASGEAELEIVQDEDTFLVTAQQASLSLPSSSLSRNRNLAHIDISFDTANPRAVEWAGNYASDVVEDLTTTTRNGLNSLIATATEQGFSTTQVANLMSNSIGLDSNSYTYVNGLADRMLAAEVGTTIKYGTKQVIVDGTLAQADRTVTGYMRHLLQVRKKRLARSLLARSANEGLHELHRQALEQDLLPSNVVRVYIQNTQRHASRDGTTVAIGESFEVEPGADANCGCTSGLQAS
jgi:hypothetical protein